MHVRACVRVYDVCPIITIIYDSKFKLSLHPYKRLFSFS